MNIGDGLNINMQQKANTETRSCYIKNICGLGSFSRYHARRTITLY